MLKPKKLQKKSFFRDKNENVTQKINKTLDFLCRTWYPYNVVLYDKEQTMKTFVKKFSIVLICILLVISLSAGSSYAASDTIMKISRQAEGPQGGTVLFRLELINLTGTGKKVSSFNGYINLDDTVFEDITVDSIVKDSNNKVTIASTGEQLEVYDLTNATPAEVANMNNAGVFFNGNPSSGNDSKIMMDFGTDIDTNTIILTLSLKIKDNAKVGTYTDAIEVKEFQVFYQDQDRADINAASYPVTVTAKSSDNTNNTTNNTTNNAVNNTANNTANNAVNNTTNNTTNNTANNIVNNTVNNAANQSGNSTQEQTQGNSTDKTTAKDIFPAAGSIISFVIPLIILAIACYVCYLKYIRFKDIK